MTAASPTLFQCGRRVLGMVALLVAIAAPATGQITGRVEGSVVDAVTGQPLIGGLVVIEETNLGNVTREDGSFFINNVPVGRHRIISEYLGYRAMGEVRRILAGQTVAVEFRMAADVIESEGIAVVIAREPFKPPPPERVYTRSLPLGTDMRAAEGFTCSAQAVLHGSFIQDGRWELQSSVRELSCREEPIEPAPEAPPDETLQGVVHISSLKSQVGQK